MQWNDQGSLIFCAPPYYVQVVEEQPERVDNRPACRANLFLKLKVAYTTRPAIQPQVVESLRGGKGIPENETNPI